MIQRSYLDSKSNCYIIPTPIGNMEDITLRAIRLLKKVDAIFAEDTRVTQNLLTNLKIKNKIYQCQKFNEIKASKLMIKLLNEGKNIAVVTDRGTPLISDPGYVALKSVVKEGYNIIALPGASALLPAINMSNLDQDKFLFYGFLDSKESALIKELESIKDLKFTIILYEAPHRLYKTLQNVLKILGNRQISISREITKLHEEVFRGSVLEALDNYKGDVKGEIVIVIEKGNTTNNIDDAYLKCVELVSLGMSSKNAIKYISRELGVSKNELYDMYEVKKNETDSGIR